MGAPVTNLPKPDEPTISRPGALLNLLVKMYEAVIELQRAAQATTPASIAAARGKTGTVVIRGATVTLPDSSATFTADVYVTGIVG